MLHILAGIIIFIGLAILFTVALCLMAKRADEQSYEHYHCMGKDSEKLQ